LVVNLGKMQVMGNIVSIEDKTGTNKFNKLSIKNIMSTLNKKFIFSLWLGVIIFFGCEVYGVLMLINKQENSGHYFLAGIILPFIVLIKTSLGYIWVAFCLSFAAFGLLHVDNGSIPLIHYLLKAIFKDISIYFEYIVTFISATIVLTNIEYSDIKTMI